ncbi:hypothetical protein MRB53_037265 [Persea americana]|nr:hypothetical protein MRB53_037265 [Persea americana]
MSTIASPRPSVTISSSRRDSISTDATNRSTSVTRGPQAVQTGSVRRNRNALRDYYGLKESAQTSQVEHSTQAEPEEESELDREGFDAEKYVKDLLAKESLESILRTEASLVTDTRNLDGEKKALVYDNYSKLIAATETIRKMRTNMDPLAPTTAELTPAISHIAETATSLAQRLREQHGNAVAQERKQAEEAAKKRTVSWVLDAPTRLKTLVKDGRQAEADEEYKQVLQLLNKWQGVPDTDRVRKECEQALGLDNS